MPFRRGLQRLGPTAQRREDGFPPAGRVARRALHAGAWGARDPWCVGATAGPSSGSAAGGTAGSDGTRGAPGRPSVHSDLRLHCDALLEPTGGRVKTRAQSAQIVGAIRMVRELAILQILMKLDRSDVPAHTKEQLLE
ncbi:hypothetical protein NDU88_006759 [Pleurodeles waltl]|uniref:Uncharacterized protein n=1 Tax=Pleurodeles waltl TaxID=8319 RepID=A0AAV7UNG8_PLEWA|nr:hypothetical protein NDU88_006759 [Pleurodeles waltl]